MIFCFFVFFFFFNDTATTEIYTLSLHDALPISPDLFEVDSAVLQRPLRRSERELGETICPPNVLGISEKRFRIKVAHFTGDLTIITGGVESFDSANAADAVLKIRPESLQLIPERSDSAQSGNDNSAIVIHGVS